MEDEEIESASLIEQKNVTKSRVEFLNDASRTNVIRTEMKLARNGTLPDVKMYISLNLKPSDILLLFKAAAAAVNFVVQEAAETSAVAEFISKVTLRDLLRWCLSTSDSHPGGKVKVNLSVNEASGLRVVFVRWVSGSAETNLPLIQTFRKKLEIALISANHRSLNFGEQEPKKVESTYQIHRILCDISHSLGKCLAEFVDSFPQDEKEPREKVQFVRMQVDKTVDEFFQQYHLGQQKDGPKSWRQVVEKFLFSRIYDKIFPLYIDKYDDDQIQFNKQVENLEQLGRQEAMQSIGIEIKFQMENKKDPYHIAIDTLSQMSSLFSPLEKINWIINCVSSFKTEVIDYWNGKEAIETMDDEFPILIYILSKVQIRFLIAEIKFLYDYVQDTLAFEREIRLLTNVDSAIRYLISDSKPNDN